MPVVFSVVEVIVVPLVVAPDGVIPLVVDSVVAGIVTVLVSDLAVVDGGCVVEDIVVASIEAVVPAVCDAPVVVSDADVIVIPLVVVPDVVDPLVVDSVVGGTVTVVVPELDVVDGGCVVEDVVVASVEAVAPVV